MNFYYDTSKLKREWSKDNLSNFADFLSEVMRSENYYKDGWSNGFVEEFYDKPDDPYAELRLEFGRDEEGHQEKFYETKTYESVEEFYKDYDYYFKKTSERAMSGFVQDWDCTQCRDGKGFQETFKDTEEGYILECLNCKYMEVYREDVDTGKVVEDYAGYEHYYNNKQARG